MKMSHSLLALLLLANFATLLAKTKKPATSTPIEVYYREQLDDMVLPTLPQTGLADRHLLIMYYGRNGSPCNRDRVYRELRMTDRKLPTNRYLLFAIYNMVDRPDQNWLDLSQPDFDLVGACGVTECPSIVFIAKGSVTTDCEIWDHKSRDEEDGQTFDEWIRSKIMTEITLENTETGTPVDLQVKCVRADSKAQLMEPSMHTIPAGKSLKLKLLPECTVAVFERNSKKFLGGYEVTNDDETIVINSEPPPYDEWRPRDLARLADRQTFEDEEDKKETNENKQLLTHDQWRENLEKTWRDNIEWNKNFFWSHTRRHLKTFKQALVVPLYTVEGYKKAKMPEELHQKLLQFYHDNKANRKEEPWPLDSFQINEHEVRTSVVTLPRQMIDECIKVLQPQVEKWIGNEPIKYRTLYGLREYYNGSVLKTHLDRVGTHALGVIMNIYQEVEEDWDLEMIKRDGKKYFVSMKAGDIVFYEPGSVPHGRPKPLQGNIYVNAFLHFYTDYWNLELTQDSKIIDKIKNTTTPLLPAAWGFPRLLQEFADRVEGTRLKHELVAQTEAAEALEAEQNAIKTGVETDAASAGLGQHVRTEL